MGISWSFLSTADDMLGKMGSLTRLVITGNTCESTAWAAKKSAPARVAWLYKKIIILIIFDPHWDHDYLPQLLWIVETRYIKS